MFGDFILISQYEVAGFVVGGALVFTQGTYHGHSADDRREARRSDRCPRLIRLTRFRILKDRPLPFYPWLRQIASERLAKLHRRHIYTQKRSVEREDEDGVMLNDRSSLLPADNFSTARSSPSNRLLRKEIRPHVKSAFGRLRGTDQEILVMRHLEQLSIREIASVLDITVTAAKSRHFPALERLRSALGDDFSEEQR